MDTQQPTSSFDESVAQVMQTLPPAIRNYLAQGTYTPVAKSLMSKYMLRIDQGGVLEREIMLLLMGIETPEEFTKALIEEAKLSQQTVNGIVQDVNTQIFMPLRDEMKKSVQQVSPKVEPQIKTPPRFFHLENKLAHPSPKATEGTAPRSLNNPSGGLSGGRSVPQNGLAKQSPTAASALNVPVPPLPQPLRPIPAKPVVSAEQRSSTLAQAIGNALNTEPKVAQQPLIAPRPTFSNIAPLPPKFISPKSWGSQTSPESRKLLEDHEEPSPSLKAMEGTAHIEFKKPQMQPVMPKVEPQIPPNLPGAMPPFPVPDVQSAPEVKEVHTLPVQPLVQPRPTSPIIPSPPKSYTVDPYREPIE